jgi:hypothetical protein
LAGQLKKSDVVVYKLNAPTSIAARSQCVFWRHIHKLRSTNKTLDWSSKTPVVTVSFKAVKTGRTLGKYERADGMKVFPQLGCGKEMKRKSVFLPDVEGLCSWDWN